MGRAAQRPAHLARRGAERSAAAAGTARGGHTAPGTPRSRPGSVTQEHPAASAMNGEMDGAAELRRL